jgi:hypothetical protein
MDLIRNLDDRDNERMAKATEALMIRLTDIETRRTLPELGVLNPQIKNDLEKNKN